jgi:phage terminase Nu1 subunit (DNA packaging protein)
MNDILILDQPVTQAVFAGLVGIGQSRVSECISTGVLRDGATVGEWLLQYCDRLRNEAAGRGGDEQGALARARTREAEASAELKILQIMEKSGKLVPVDEIQPTLDAMVIAARTELLAIPDKLTIEIKALYGVEIDYALIEEKIYSALNHLAGKVLPDVINNMYDENGDFRYE